MSETQSKYRTKPDQENRGWPPGIPFIVGNEGCERFSFYGMKAILFVHLTALYLTTTGADKATAESNATADVHLFIAAVYALPMVGAILAERLLGKYRTIMALSLVYCAGHGVLALGEDSIGGMRLGLALIAIGSGGIKPCVSANVGDQFGRSNWFRVQTVFQIFYFSINFGSFGATLAIPYLKAEFGSSVAFGVPGLLMLLATIVFWLGRNRYVHIPPHPGGKLGLLDSVSSLFLFLSIGHFFFSGALALPLQLALSVGFLLAGFMVFRMRQRVAEDNGFLAVLYWTLVDRLSGGKTPLVNRDDAALDDPVGVRRGFWGRACQRFGLEAAEGPPAVFRVMTVFVLVSVFWALFDQHSSSWIQQAERMYRPVLFGRQILASQIPALNPLLVMLLIPIMNGVYSIVGKLGYAATPLRRMTVGMFVAALAFVSVALIQMRIEAAGDGEVNVFWQLISYVLVTAAEVMVSVNGLEFAYTQAPRRMKSIIMSFWLLTVSFGNVLVALIARYLKLEPVAFFWFFAGLMGVAWVFFGLRARFYVPRDYTQR